MPKWGIYYHVMVNAYTEVEAETKEKAEELFDENPYVFVEKLNEVVEESDYYCDEIEEIKEE